MLALLGLVTVLALLVAIMTKRMSPLVALVLIPTAAAFIGGFGREVGSCVTKGLESLAPVVAMFVFAILFFGVVTDAGVLDPVVGGVLRAVGARPRWVVVGTALLALVVHLDGSGAVTFLVTIPAMLPVYDRLGMDRRVLAAASLAAGANFLPWTGPMIRASAALKIPAAELFRPLVPVQVVGLAFVFGVCYVLGRREEQRLGLRGAGAGEVAVPERTLTDAERRLRRPDRFWVNAALTAAVLGVLVAGSAPPALVFLVGTALALLVNYPDADTQRARVDAHARSALLMAGILIAAGVFTGIMQGSGMLRAMAVAAVGHVPAGSARYLPVVLGLVSMPLSLLFDPDSFYFGVLPVVAEVGRQFTGGTVAALGDRLLSANAYLGAAPIVEALAGGADVVVTGRVADPALFLAPLVHEFGWRMDDWTRLAAGTLAGHLLECAGQVTGGYFADPGYKDVAGLARLGFPIGQVAADGSVVITKVPGSGGAVTARTCTEQLLYEVHDPGCYLTPDVVVDLTAVTVTEVAPDRVLVAGAAGRPRPATLKVSIGYYDGYVGEGQISFAGPGAVARGRLALAIVAERLALTGVPCTEARYDLVGVDALHGRALAAAGHEPYEVRARVAARTATLDAAVRIGNEVETLYTNGPAGGGGVTKAAREVVAVASTFLPRDAVRPRVEYLEA